MLLLVIEQGRTMQGRSSVGAEQGHGPPRNLAKKKLCVILAQSTETTHAHTQHLVSSQASTGFAILSVSLTLM